ncbi:MAG: hypothetical protein M3460_23865 [Actinomycetota bacterium]|nr:hypothetical protein [Actinomycetota bacterium]
MSTPHSTVTGTPAMDPYPSCATTTAGARPDPGTAPRVRAWTCAGCGTWWAITVASPRPWLVQLAGKPVAVRSVLQSVVTLAEQAPELSDEQLRSRLSRLRRLAR